ncbi:aminotransferase class IV [Vitiosangium sp. GDMCC 1.1324]|uniref:aminotransferase class IV n=1 Tax=Vitiosangium sp. (strain GDMCC 1.1324) TaxID=2138576 RepID=UPI000D352DD9|nr:aminotransferase class IV [Vitiosangium sp. GDMCC 1.1324]PTL79284.1 aminotransferase IV [Vitiosangium sp. GDMCC 1.1324]
MRDTVAVNGEVRRLEELRLQDFLQSYFFGAGFFETFLVTGGAPMFLERHLARLRSSLAAHADSVRAPPPEVLIAGSVRDALRRCLEADPHLGPGFTGIGKLVAGDGRLLLSFRDLAPQHERTLREGCVLDELEDRGYRRGDPTLNHKSISYLRQYVHLGRGTVFANEAGELCEVPNGNLFFLVGDSVVTPPLEAPCLPGIIRSVLLEEGRLGGMPVVERPMKREGLEDVSGCVLTNSVSLALAVPRLLGRELPGSHALAEHARAVVREHARRED